MTTVGDRSPLRVLVRHRADAIAAAAMVRELVRTAGGSARRASTVATATSELAQNIVSHAGGDGELLMWLDGCDVVIQARDRGLGSSPTRPGLGQGQASVRRLMDTVEFERTESGGLLVTARTDIRIGRAQQCS